MVGTLCGLCCGNRAQICGSVAQMVEKVEAQRGLWLYSCCGGNSVGGGDHVGTKFSSSLTMVMLLIVL